MIIKKMPPLNFIATILVLVGGLNLGLVGLFGFSLIDFIFRALSRPIYLVIGVAAGYLVYEMFIKKEK